MLGFLTRWEETTNSTTQAKNRVLLDPGPTRWPQVESEHHTRGVHLCRSSKIRRPIGLDEKIKVDLIVIGSVAVDPTTGARLG